MNFIVKVGEGFCLAIGGVLGATVMSMLFHMRFC